MKLAPVLTPEQQAEFDKLESEAILEAAMQNIADEMFPVTPTGHRYLTRIQASDRQYIVQRDGSFRRVR